MSCKVSVIIPVYNAEKYLKKMIDCLYEQTLKDIEFIFVDDCSTDESLNILYELEKKDPERVLIIKLDENQGPGGARNIGMQYASGEYLGFADSDDLLKKEMYEILYNKAVAGDYDIVDSGYYSERKNRNMMLWNDEVEGKVTFDNRVKMIMSCGFIVSKIFKREFVINSGIEFITKIPFEDVDFLTRLYLRADSVGIVDKPLYYYRDNLDSFSHKRNGQSFIYICNTFCKKYLQNMKNEKLYSIFKPVIDYVIIGIWFDIYKSYISAKEDVKLDKVSEIKNQLKEYVPDFDKNIFFTEKAKKDELKRKFIMNV